MTSVGINGESWCGNCASSQHPVTLNHMNHGIKAKTHTHCESAYFPTRKLLGNQESHNLWPHGSWSPAVAFLGILQFPNGYVFLRLYPSKKNEQHMFGQRNELGR